MPWPWSATAAFSMRPSIIEPGVAPKTTDYLRLRWSYSRAMDAFYAKHFRANGT